MFPSTTCSSTATPTEETTTVGEVISSNRSSQEGSSLPPPLLEEEGFQLTAEEFIALYRFNTSSSSSLSRRGSLLEPEAGPEFEVVKRCP